MNKIYNFLITTFVLSFGAIHGATKYYYNIDSIDLLRNFSFIFLIFLFLITIKKSIIYLQSNTYFFIFFCLIFFWNVIYLLLDPASGEYFYSPIFLLIPLAFSYVKLQQLANFILKLSFLFCVLYTIQLLFFVLFNGDFIIIEKHYFDVLQLGSIKFSTSFIFGNSNSAGSLLFMLLILSESLSINKKINIFFIFIGIILSGSLTSFLLGFACLVRKNFKKISLKNFLYGIPVIALLILFIQINTGGFSARIDRWTNFIFLLFTKPFILLIPNNLLGSNFYSESSIIDMFVNFGLLPIYLFCRLLYNSKLYFILLYFILTNSVFLPINAFIIGILLKSEHYELSYKTR